MLWDSSRSRYLQCYETTLYLWKNLYEWYDINFQSNYGFVKLVLNPKINC